MASERRHPLDAVTGRDAGAKGGGKNAAAAMPRLAWHFDFHSHKSIRINHDPDVRTMADTLAEAGVEEIITFAKCHTGFAYYPSRVGTPHPRMLGDPFGDVARACKARGIRVLAYVSFGIDGEAGRRHPEWAQVADPAKGAVITEDHFVSMCPYTPYLEESMLPMVREILDGYPVDGFFFDTMGALGVCHCRFCRQEFQAAHGRAIPLDPNDPDWSQYGAFRRERAWRMVGKVGQYILARGPAMKVGFNWVGTSVYPERAPQGVTCVTCDFSVGGAQSLQASFHAAYGKTSELPCDVMYTISNYGWGDWAPRPLAGLEQTGVTVWAHGCRPYLGDRLHPTNRLDPISARAIRHMGGVQRRLAGAWPDADAAQPNEILIVTGPRNQYGADMRDFAVGGPAGVPLMGMHRLLLDAGYPMAIVPEDLLERRLAGAKAAILCENRAVTAATARALRAFVEGGGRLLVTGRIPDADGAGLDWLGVARDGKPWQDHIYLPLWRRDPEKSPVLVHGAFHRLTLRPGVETVLSAIQPYDCGAGMRFGHGTGPASSEPSDAPALTRRRLGKGEAWYLEAPIGSDYCQKSNIWQADWLRGLMQRLLPHPAARVVSAAGSVEIVPYVSRGATWAFLINHGGEQLASLQQAARTFAQVPPYPIAVELRIPRGREPGRVTAGGRRAAWTRDGATLRLNLTMNRIWTVVKAVWR